MGRLVLQRRVGEEITIGDDITVTVVRIDGRSVRLGITAPRDVQVHRTEVEERIKRGEPVTLPVRPTRSLPPEKDDEDEEHF